MTPLPRIPRALRRLYLVTLSVGLLLVASCPAGARDTPLRVVTSIPPLAMLVQELGGDRVVVRSLLAAGADPHTYEPRPSDAAALQDADVVVSLGSSLDDWLGGAIRARDGAVVVTLDAGDGQPGAVHDAGHAEGGHGPDGHASNDPHASQDLHGSHDPHVWLDPLWVRDHAIAPLHRALVAADPADAARFGQQARTMSEDLSDLDAVIRAGLAGTATRSFLAWHPAWGCFARRYGLHSAGSVGESEGREPSLKAMIAALRAARAAGVKAVLVEPQEDARHARVLADELGVDLVTVDPLGDARSADRGTYAALMRFNARAFARALGVAADGKH